MKCEIIHNQLQELLETIQEQYGTIRTTEGRIPQIEFDILLENLRKFYDQLHLLQRMNDPHVTPTSPLHHDTTAPSPPPPHYGTTATPSPPPSPPEIKSVEHPKAAVRKEEEPEKKVPKTADMDLFADEEPSFNMKLQEAREMSLPQKPEPIEHLKQLISINDKFIFINELFDGNLKEYNEAIETLNGFKTKNEALDYLDQLRKKNVWELGSGTIIMLKEIVEKYFL